MTHVKKGCKRRIGMVTVAIASVALVASMGATAQTAIVSDSTFLDANWTLATFFAGNAGSVIAAQSGVIGNPAPSRVVSDTVGAAPSISTESVIMGVSIYTSFTYDPAVSGAIGTINYSEDAACTAGCFGQGQSTGPALLQGANMYILSSSTVVTGPALTWANHSLTGLTAADFGLVRVMSNGTLFDNTNHPNFSAGAPIVFGFFRANGTGVSGPGYTLSAGIDNWQVTIAAAGLPAAAAVPTLGGWVLALLAFGIALTGFAWTRRAR